LGYFGLTESSGGIKRRFTIENTAPGNLGALDKFFFPVPSHAIRYNFKIFKVLKKKSPIRT